MNKEGLNSINKLIAKYVIEIMIIIVLVVISYGSFTKSNLSSAMSIAEDSVNNMRDMQMSYKKTSENESHIKNTENILDEGILSIKNTNKVDVITDIMLYVKYDEMLNTGSYQIGIDGKIVELKNAELIDGYYVIKLDTKNIQKYSYDDATVTVYGNPYNATRLRYTFKTVENFS